MPPITLEESMLMLEGTGPVLEIARELSRLLMQSGVQGAIIGGVAVSLHGYVRTTVDVDVFLEHDLQKFASVLKAHGFVLDEARREITKRGVPVHLVTRVELTSPPQHFEERHGIRTVALADLINMKLRSGTRSVLRAKDIGDAIGLIRHHGLTKDFTPRIENDLRPEFQRLIVAIDREGGRS